ncbi:hypothetical protein [Actinoplanes palleronii]|uniref:PLL-like beta propeller domain-containing protein n=1 Tax=Actinoplanes palleronii TaxID=113570 RepID=A0ABQ4BHA4_9ACTN|nr:hypothetical protein [Actinoplanes palleronii]GIE70033.1 hypothetical protein Apa02nite_061410 [Actinoplanes palleronii]
MIGFTSTATCLDRDSRRHLFATADAGEPLPAVWHSAETRPGEWSDWAPLGRLRGSYLQVCADQAGDGRIAVLALPASPGEKFGYLSQRPDGSFGGWERLDAPPSTSHAHSLALVHGPEGRAEVFLGTYDDGPWHCRQDPAGRWGAWTPLRRPPGGADLAIEGLTVARTAAGGFAVFVATASGTGRVLWSTGQDRPGGTWSEWLSLGRYPSDLTPSTIVVHHHVSGRLQVLVTAGREVRYRAQADRDDLRSWLPWQFWPIPSDELRELVAAFDEIGDTVVVATTVDGEPLWQKQETPLGSGWQRWARYPNPAGEPIHALHAGLTTDRRLRLFAIGRKTSTVYELSKAGAAPWHLQHQWPAPKPAG